MDKETIINNLQTQLDQVVMQKTALENLQITRLAQFEVQKEQLIANYNRQLQSFEIRQNTLQNQINELSGE